MMFILLDLPNQEMINYHITNLRFFIFKKLPNTNVALNDDVGVKIMNPSQQLTAIEINKLTNSEQYFPGRKGNTSHKWASWSIEVSDNGSSDFFRSKVYQTALNTFNKGIRATMNTIRCIDKLKDDEDYLNILSKYGATKEDLEDAFEKKKSPFYLHAEKNIPIGPLIELLEKHAVCSTVETERLYLKILD